MTSPQQIADALRVLADAGLQIHVPGAKRLELVSVGQLRSMWGIGERKARDIITSLPGSVRLAGNDLRARVSDLERYLEQHPIA